MDGLAAEEDVRMTETANNDSKTIDNSSGRSRNATLDHENNVANTETVRNPEAGSDNDEEDDANSDYDQEVYDVMAGVATFGKAGRVADPEYRAYLWPKVMTMKQKMIHEEVRISMGLAPDEDKEAWARILSVDIGPRSPDPLRFANLILNPRVVLECLRRRTIVRMCRRSGWECTWDADIEDCLLCRELDRNCIPVAKEQGLAGS